MLDFVAQELAASPEWRRVLEAYLHEAAQRPADPADEGWLPRIARIDGVDPAHLSRLHGRLIALGCLKFELSGKAGVQYQLTPLGRQTLDRGLTAAELSKAEATAAQEAAASDP